jgi:hypothetical protein
MIGCLSHWGIAKQQCVLDLIFRNVNSFVPVKSHDSWEKVIQQPLLGKSKPFIAEVCVGHFSIVDYRDFVSQ